ncbi:MAG: hypothetical protein PHV39_05480 [Methanomicrobium sp.]|nr:hypothetical protein [Methanomicrobium sp.]
MDLTGQMIVYLLELPQKALSGDMFAIMVSLIILYSLVYILVKSAKLMKNILKKLVLFFIIAMAVYIFLMDFVYKVITYGFTPDIILFGFTGLMCGLFALAVALFKMRAALKRRALEKQKAREAAGSSVQSAYPAYNQNLPPDAQPTPQAQVQNPFIPQQITNFAKDNSIGMVIIYLIVAEFGIFSSNTIAAVNEDTGLAFFMIFMFAALIFIKLTYNNYKTGIGHLIVAFIMGYSLSIILGYFWGGISLDVLFSKGYFATDALVALISGLSLSLFMSGKG